MPSLKKTALSLVLASFLGTFSIMAFLLFFPKKEIATAPQPIVTPSPDMTEVKKSEDTILPSSDKQENIPKTITLTESSWEWTESTLEDGTKIHPKQPGIFILTFLDDSRFGITTDCNRMGGTYTLIAFSETEGSIAFSPMYSTKITCSKQTQEQTFLTQLQKTTSLHFDPSAKTLGIQTSSELMIFHSYTQPE